MNQSKSSSIDINSFQGNNAVKPISTTSITNYEASRYAASHGDAREAGSRHTASITSPHDQSTLQALADLEIAERSAIAKQQLNTSISQPRLGSDTSSTLPPKFIDQTNSSIPTMLGYKKIPTTT